MKYDHIHDALIDLTGINLTDDEIQKIVDKYPEIKEPNSWDLSLFIGQLCIDSMEMNIPRYGSSDEYKLLFNENTYKLNLYISKIINH